MFDELLYEIRSALWCVYFRSDITSTIEHSQSTSMSGHPGTQTSNQERQMDAKPKETAKVIRIYGLPGVGKTALIEQLKRILGEDDFSFYEGAKVVLALAGGDLTAFEKMPEDEKHRFREQAITKIATECANNGTTAVVTGCFMMWKQGKQEPAHTWTEEDEETLTHIIYLKRDSGAIVQQCIADKTRFGEEVWSSHIERWQWFEQVDLKFLCPEHHILLIELHAGTPGLAETVSVLIRDFVHHSESRNQTKVVAALDEIVHACDRSLETLLVIDGDKTLGPVDPRDEFWSRHESASVLVPFRALILSTLGFSYYAFRQAALLLQGMLLHGGQGNPANLEEYCARFASRVVMHTEFRNLLREVVSRRHVGAVVITCGVRRIWEMVLQNAGFASTVKVIGGGCIEDDCVITPEMKRELVARLQVHHHLYVWAFGDGPLDPPMLRQADRAIVVVGKNSARSTEMDEELDEAIIDGSLKAHQVLLPDWHTRGRLGPEVLPIVELSHRDFVENMMAQRGRRLP